MTLLQRDREKEDNIRIEHIKKLLAKGYSVEDIAEMLDYSVDYVHKLAEKSTRYQPA